MIKIDKATRHVFTGHDKNEGTLVARCGGSTAVAALLLGPCPAQISPEDGDEGMGIFVIDKEITSPSAAGVAVGTVPKGAIPLGGQIITKTAGTAAGTSTTVSMGIAGTVDKYCTMGAPTQADSVAKNGKGKKQITAAPVLAADEPVLVYAAATGGASAGDTTLTNMVVRAVVYYKALVDLKNYA